MAPTAQCSPTSRPTARPASRNLTVEARYVDRRQRASPHSQSHDRRSHGGKPHQPRLLEPRWPRQRHRPRPRAPGSPPRDICPPTKPSSQRASSTPVDATPMDFRSFKAIGRDIGADFPALKIGGYDACWAVDGYVPGEVRTVATSATQRRAASRGASDHPGDKSTPATGSRVARQTKPAVHTTTTTAWPSSARDSPLRPTPRPSLHRPPSGRDIPAPHRFHL